MIITQKVYVKINQSNLTYYDDLGFNTTIGDTITVPVNLLSYGSHYLITCKCDNCGIEKEMMYKNYLKYNNDWGYYTCRTCSEEKRKEALKLSFNVEYPMQNANLFNKMQNTIIEKYGVDNPNKIKKH